jgi:hypothetical protein
LPYEQHRRHDESASKMNALTTAGFIALTQASKDHLEGARAFIEKRKVQFKGR